MTPDASLTPTAGLGVRALKALGLAVEEAFIPESLRLEIIGQARGAPNESAASIYNDERGSHVNEKFRSTRQATLQKDLRAQIVSRLKTLRPAMEAHFRTALSDIEDPLLLKYRRGDFFKPHIDGSDSGDLAARRVSVVLFINQARTGSEGDYAGGALRVYGLIPDERWKRVGLPIQPRGGTLVAFSSNLLHEVTPVSDGERLTIVSWYHAARAA